MFGPDCSRCGGYFPGNPGAYLGSWCYCPPKPPPPPPPPVEVNPMKMPSFVNDEAKIEWLREAIEICSNYPDQGMQLLVASFEKELEDLLK